MGYAGSGYFLSMGILGESFGYGQIFSAASQTKGAVLSSKQKVTWAYLCTDVYHEDLAPGALEQVAHICILVQLGI